MPRAAAASTPRRRPRHDPKETEREILDAAEQLLRERPFRDITVEEIMRRTGLKRPAFYAHFRDRNDLTLRIAERIGADLLGMSDRWLSGDRPERDIRTALEGVAAIFAENGPVLRALADAAGSDTQVELVYEGLVQAFIDAAARRIQDDVVAGLITADIDPRETARALVWLNERYLSQSIGRDPHADRDTIVNTLERIWIATLYGDNAS
ncbi:MAG: TetR/AcrR family transcriptional regulator [Solirubrobacteraceae bacterium]